MSLDKPCPKPNGDGREDRPFPKPSRSEPNDGGREERPFPKPSRGGPPDDRAFPKPNGGPARNARLPGQIVRGAVRPSSQERGLPKRGDASSAGYAGPPPAAPRAAPASRNQQNAGRTHPVASDTGSQASRQRSSEASSNSTSRPAMKPASKASSKMTQVQVFVRWRPLVGAELKRGDAAIQYMCTEDKGASVVSVTSDRTRVKTWTGGRFAGVFKDREDNIEVFERAVTPMLSIILAGKSACCFCYGHTGSGKTHTILGYGQEFGLYRLGAARIFETFATVKDQPPGGLQLSVRFAELHCDRAFDLMDQRAECKVREDADGAVHFRKDPIVHPDGRVSVRPMSSIRCKSVEDVAAAVAVGSLLRVVGSSSLHDQSSRSHAILEMEVVTDELIAARESVIHEESLLVPLGKALEEINFNAAQGQDVDLGKKDELQACVRDQADALEAARERLAQVMVGGHPGLGGTLVLVDLAGSENGADADAKKQSKEEIREGKDINKSLLFLKEVVRALATGNGHVPFRSCRLTRVMRHWLRDGCCCSMVANVSTSDLHAAKALSTLQYAALVASAGA